MKLRLRLALTLLAIAAPLVGALAWWRSDLLRSTAEEQIRVFVLARMEDGGRARCEAEPETFPDPPGARPQRDPIIDPLPPRLRPPRMRPGNQGPARALPPRTLPQPAPMRIELHAYHPDFHSANPASPAFPSDLKTALEKGDEIASTAWQIAGHGGLQVALRMPWSDGPCAVMLARRPGPGAGAETAADNFLWSALALCAVLFGAVLFAAGPIVRRVRKLTSQVRRSAADRYATPVDDVGKDEIAELAQAFNAAGAELRVHLGELESREKTLRAFVENTTHDVMLPLTVLQGHLTALRNRLDAGGAIEREVVLDSLEEAHYLASLVQNLGVAAKLETGEPVLHRHPFRLDELVERAVGRHRPIAKPRGIGLDFALPEAAVWIEGDVTLVEQAVSNVVHNAVRYNESGGHVLVLLETKSGDGFALRVIDDGPGVSDEILARLSERSFRSDDARRRHPDGLGLGLAIAQDVAARHGFTFAIRRSGHGGLEVELSGPVVVEQRPQRA